MGIDLKEGDTVGVWKVLCIYSTKRGPICKCSCVCGEIRDIRRSDLVAGARKSCGCATQGAREARTIAKIKQMTGEVFDRLTVVGFHGRGSDKGGKTVLLWDCRCSCGGTKVVNTSKLKRGLVRSCGCLIVEANRTHGLTGTRVAYAYGNMLKRCYDETNKRFRHYGGRGIKVCDRWLGEGGLQTFFEDMGPAAEGMTLGRKDNNAGYSPENCQWETKLQQAQNKSTSLKVTLWGETRCLRDWARILKQPYGTVHARARFGWSLKAALLTPIGGVGTNSSERIEHESKFSERPGAVR